MSRDGPKGSRTRCRAQRRVGGAAPYGSDLRSDTLRVDTNPEAKETWMRLVNATPHTLRVFAEDRVIVEVPKAERPARAATTDVVVGHVQTPGGSIPLVASRLGEVYDLPDPEPNTLVVVSQLVADLVGRDDLVVPHQLVRDADGAVIGCRSLRQIARRS